MPSPRFLATLSLLLITLGWGGLWQRQETLHPLDEAYLSFLSANVREHFTLADQAPSKEVVWVQVREEDRADYEVWPPPPLDWLTLLKSLQIYDPSVLVIATPLTWGVPEPDFVPAVAEALLPFASVVLAVEAESVAPDQAGSTFMGELRTAFPMLQNVTGDPATTPVLKGLRQVPEARVRAQKELGLITAPRWEAQRWHLPYALRVEDSFLPSVIAQSLARHTRSTYATSHRLRLGPGASASLEGGLWLPLRASGELRIPTVRVPTVNALHLMTGLLADGTTDEDKAALSEAQIIVVSVEPTEAEGAAPSPGQLTAAALQHALSLPRLQKFSRVWQGVVWALAGLGGGWIALRVRPERALLAGGGALLALLTVSLLLFQSHFIWCPPIVPTALICVGTGIARWGSAGAHHLKNSRRLMLPSLKESKEP